MRRSHGPHARVIFLASERKRNYNTALVDDRDTASNLDPTFTGREIHSAVRFHGFSVCDQKFN
jgi:hypothetical protein